MKEKAKLKICHVITRMIVGGAQENTLLSVIGLLVKGHDVTLVTGPSEGPEGELLKANPRLKECHVKIIEIDSLTRNINPLKDLKAYFDLKRFFKENEFDVVHTHSSKAGIIGRFAAYSCRVPYIVHTIHGQAFHINETKIRNLLYQYLEKQAARKCHKIYAVAQAMIDQCIEKQIATPDKYKVVYSGMNLEPYLNLKRNTKLQKQLKIPENAPVVGKIARLFHLKGYDYFISIAARLVKKIPDIHFLIVGDGILKDELQTQIKKLGIQDRFIFTGLISPEEVPDYLSLMNILVHLSLREGLPRAVVQALAAAKPAVAFNLDGTPEVLIEGQTGYVAEAGDVDKVYNDILKLIRKPDSAKKLGLNGRELVQTKFDWKYMCDCLEADYFHGLSSKS